MSREDFNEKMKDKPVGPRQGALDAGGNAYMHMGGDG